MAPFKYLFWKKNKDQNKVAIHQSVNQSIIQSVSVYLKNTANLLEKRLKKKIEEPD
jgi:hypothetical protein